MKIKSDEGRRIAKLNKYPHKLGSGGYEGKSAEWRTVLEQNKIPTYPWLGSKILGAKIGSWVDLS